MIADDEGHRSLAFRIGRPPVEGRLEVAGNGLEQLATGRELTMPAGNEVLETTGERIGLCIAAHLHHVCASGRVLGVSVENHLGLLRLDVISAIQWASRASLNHACRLTAC